MSFDAGSIAGKLGLDISGYEGGMLRATAIAGLFPATVTNFLANPLLGVIGIAQDVANSIAGAIGSGVKLAADFEQAQVALGTMLGGAEQAKAVLADLSNFANSTPFELPELVDATKKLVAFGVEQQDLMTTMQQVGDVAAGLGIPFNQLAEIYGKAKVQGTLFMEDINQLAGRGIPIQQELAKQFGITTDKVRELVSSGKVSFSNLQEAFASLTGEGGKFHAMMEAQSKTLAGLWSSLEDAKNTVLREVGTELVEQLDVRGIVGDVTKFVVDHKQDIVDAVKAVGDELGKVIDWLRGNWSEISEVGAGAFKTLGESMESVGPVLKLVADGMLAQLEALNGIVGAIDMVIGKYQQLRSAAGSSGLGGFGGFLLDSFLPDVSGPSPKSTSPGSGSRRARGRRRAA